MYSIKEEEKKKTPELGTAVAHCFANANKSRRSPSESTPFRRD
jgi:hypothetical protein